MGNELARLYDKVILKIEINIAKISQLITFKLICHYEVGCEPILVLWNILKFECVGNR